MQKNRAGEEKVSEKTKEISTGEEKRPEHKKQESGPTSRGKGHLPLPGGCNSEGCKAHATRFNFCDEHYEHFKFGLIKKTGEPVSDYEKKLGHFAAHQAKRSAKKVA